MTQSDQAGYCVRMTLDEWLTTTGTTNTALAALLGVTKVTVGRWRQGARCPSLSKALEISEATGGAVRPEDLTPPTDEGRAA